MPICSWLVARGFKAAGLDFGEPERSVTPGDIMRFASTQPEKYQIERVR
jgi:hypothetical protein